MCTFYNCPLVDPITNSKLVRKLVIPKVSSCWESLAVSLQLEPSCVAVIKENSGGEQKKCCASMIEQWISTDKGVSPKTWPVLLQAIANTSKLGNIASSIKDELIKH